MEIDKEFWTTLIWTVINILLLYFILKKLLFKPVTNYMENRTNKIKEALDMAEEAKGKIESLEQEQEAKLKEIKNEGAALIASYQKKAEDEYNKVIEQAKKDSEMMIENTRNELAVEKEQLMANLKDEITSLVLGASAKLLDKNIDNDANRKLVEEFIKEEK